MSQFQTSRENIKTYCIHTERYDLLIVFFYRKRCLPLSLLQSREELMLFRSLSRLEQILMTETGYVLWNDPLLVVGMIIMYSCCCCSAYAIDHAPTYACEANYQYQKHKEVSIPKINSSFTFTRLVKLIINTRNIKRSQSPTKDAVTVTAACILLQLHFVHG